MLKMNRTTEYGIMALRHMARKQAALSAKTPCSEVTSAREISDSYGLPFEITAKTLQRLKDCGLIASSQGARGGYVLQRTLSEVNLAEFVSLMEGPLGVVPCANQASSGLSTESASTRGELVAPLPVLNACEYQVRCELRGVMGELNGKLVEFLKGITLGDLMRTTL